MRKYEEQVRRGMVLLDEKRPGWREKVSRQDLKMNNCSRCVLGQIVGNFHTARFELRLDADSTSPHGFDVTLADVAQLGYNPAYEALRDEWLLQLSEPAPESVPTPQTGEQEIKVNFREWL